MTTFDILRAARAAWPALQGATTEAKNAALHSMADALVRGQGEILAANAVDM